MPRNDGGSPLTEYLLEMRDKKGKSEWTQVQILPIVTTSFRVAKLNENNAYYFRIKAANTVGYSEPKTIDKPVKPQKQSGKLLFFSSSSK